MSSADKRMNRVLIGLGIAAIGQCGIWLHVYRPWATLLMVAGCLLSALAAGPPAQAVEVEAVVAQGRARGRSIVGFALAVVGIALFGYTSWELFVSWNRSFDWAAPSMLAAVALTSAGLSLIDRPWRKPQKTIGVTASEVFAVLLVFLLAAFLRFYKITSFPPTDGFCAIEEPQSGMGAWQILSEGARPWEFLVDRWLAVPFFHWFGVDLVNLRLPYAFVSWLTVVATYALCRQLMSWPAALLGAFLLAVSHWHLLYARLAHAIFPSTLFSVLGWWLCVRQATTGGFRLYPWIGFWCGYSLYVYAAFRATPLLIGLFFAPLFVHALFSRKGSAPPVCSPQPARSELVSLFVGVGLMAVFFAGPALALVGQLRANPSYFFEAFIRSYNNKAYYASDWPTWIAVRWKRLQDTAAIFHHRGDPEPSYNLPGEPMLDPVSGVLVTVGLLYCLRYGRHRYQWFFATVFLFIVLTGTLLTQSLSVNRLPAAVPLAFVLAAFFADRVWQLASASAAAWKRSAVITTAAAVVISTLAYNYDVYFRRAFNSRAIREVYRNFYTVGIVYLHSLPSDAYLYFVSDMHNFFQPSDYAWWRGDRVPGRVSTDLYPLLAGAPGPWKERQLRVLIQHPFEQAELGRLLERYVAGARCEWVRHPENFPHLDQLACSVPSERVRGDLHSELRASYRFGPRGDAVLRREEPSLSWGLVPDLCGVEGPPGEQPCAAEWEGTFSLPEGQSAYTVVLEARNAAVSGSIDDYAVSLQPGIPVTGYLTFGSFSSQRFSLPPGRHRLWLRAEYSDRVNIGVRLLYQPAPGLWQLVEF